MVITKRDLNIRYVIYPITVYKNNIYNNLNVVRWDDFLIIEVISVLITLVVTENDFKVNIT